MDKDWVKLLLSYNDVSLGLEIISNSNESHLQLQQFHRGCHKDAKSYLNYWFVWSYKYNGLYVLYFCLCMVGLKKFMMGVLIENIFKCLVLFFEFDLFYTHE